MAAAGRLDAAPRPGVNFGTLYTALPGINTDTQPHSDPWVRGRGGTGLLTVELDDDYDAVQIGVENNQPGGWTIDRLAVAPSAGYGADALIGASPHDLDGNPIGALLPVQFSSGGANTAPDIVPGSLVSLPAGSAAGPGATVLGFATTSGGPAYGDASPAPGWYVADGLGCIAPGTRVSAVTPASVTLDRPVLALGCAVGQAIDFSARAIGPYGQPVPPVVAESGATSLTFSDWVPLASLPRTDAGFPDGASVRGPGIAPGTRLAGTAAPFLLLDRPLKSALPARSPVTVGLTKVTSAASPAGATVLPVTDTTGLRLGQTVAGDPSIAPSTHVASLGPLAIGLDRPLVGALRAGRSVMVSGRVWLAAPGQAGDTALHVPSVLPRPLLHLRYFTGAGQSPSVHMPSCQPDPVADAVPCEAPLGLAPWWSLIGATGRDGIDQVASVGGEAGDARPGTSMPTFFLRFRGRHAGVSMLVCGGSQTSGSTGSVSGTASFARIAAARLMQADPSVPRSTAVVASAGLHGFQRTYANCEAWLPAILPSIVVEEDCTNAAGATVSVCLSGAQTLGEAAIAQGTQPIVYLAYPEATAQTGELPVAVPVQASTSVPLLTGANADVAPNGALLLGDGVPPGTTASIGPGQWTLQASRPLTLPAGAILHWGYVVKSLDPDGQGITFTANAFQTRSNTTIAGPGVPTSPKTRLRTTINTATGRAAAPIASPPGTELTDSFPGPADGGIYLEAAEAFRAQQNQPWAAVQLDALKVVSTDPVHPNLLCRGCTTQGTYGNDWAASQIADAFLPILLGLDGDGRR